MEAKQRVEAMLRGELGNFARDAIEYYQKTGLSCPANLPAYVKRIVAISFEAGRKEGEGERLSRGCAEPTICKAD